jgi:glycosyltransferase involved in cell wall biosynthesis
VRRLSIAFVTQYYPPEVGAPQARVLETARAWVKAGHTVTVLTGMPNHPTGVVPPRWRGRLSAVEREPGIEVRRSWLLPARSKGAMRRMLAHATCAATSFLRGSSGLRAADVFVATSPPLFTGLVGLTLARAARRPFVLDVRDLWPDAIVDLGLSKNGAAVRALRGLERHLYRKADRVTAVTESFAERITKSGAKARRVAVVKNGVDLARFTVLPDRATARAALKVPNKFTVLYLGAHGVAQGLDKLLPAAKALEDKVTFLFVGEGAEKERLKAEAEKIWCKGVVFHDAIAREHVPYAYAAADVVLVSLRKTPLMETFLPSKAFEAMGAGKPVVAAVAGEAAKLFQEGGAIVVPPGDAGALAIAIKGLVADPARVAALSKEARARAEKEFDRDALATRWLRVLEDAIFERRRARA